MVSKDWAWIPRSDRLALTFSVSEEVGVLVPRAETTGLLPIRLIDEGGVIAAASEPDYAPSLELLMGGVQIGLGERAVYSAQRGRLYLAGQEAGWRVFDAKNGTLEPSRFDRQPVGALEGMTLDTLNNRIFTLEVEEISEEDSVAHIVSYQLASGASKIHWTVPFTGMYERLALVADEGGALLLIASTTQDIVAWRYGVGNDGLQALGRFDSTSRLLDEPHHASKMVPVLRKDGADLLDLDPAKFVPGAECVSL